MALIKKRKPMKKTRSKKKVEPLLPGQKTMERSCATCRQRKVRCSGDRPACSLCIRGAVARGLIAEGVRCCYAGASFFAKEGDGEVEARLGGRGAKCEWGEVKVCEGAGATPTVLESVETASSGNDPASPSSASSPPSIRSLSPFSSTASTALTSPSFASLSPVAVLRPQPLPSPPRPLTPPAASSVASSVPPSRSISPPPPARLPVPPPPSFAVVHRPPSPPPSFAPLPSSLFLTLPLRLPPPPSAAPLVPSSSTTSQQYAPSAFSDPTHPSLPLVPTTDHFWHGGPLSDEDLKGWSGLAYVAAKCQRG